MSISMDFMIAPMEQLISSFMDKVVERNQWNKEELVLLWNSMSQKKPQHQPNVVHKKQIDNEEQKQPNNDTQKQKQSKHMMDHEQCIFKITRGDKLGERCKARAKEHTSYCVKHTKDDKKDDKPELKKDKEQKEKVNEHENSSVRMEEEFKKKENMVNSFETDVIVGHTVVKGTNVVINKDKQVIGYIKGNELCSKSNEDTESVIRTYKLLWGNDEIDE